MGFKFKQISSLHDNKLNLSVIFWRTHLDALTKYFLNSPHLSLKFKRVISRLQITEEYE